jgi:YD repeat-containing protein
VVTSWTDDDLNRLVSMSQMLGNTTLFSQTFTLNDDGTRAASHQTQLQPDGSTITTDTTWSNDALGRLTQEVLTNDSDASQSYTDTFLYDLVGNRLQSTHTGPGNGADETIDDTYNGDDQLTKEDSTLSGETDLAYDPNGSLTTSTPLANPSVASTYGYDVRNKMVSADVNGVASAYVYDDAGNRVGETTGGVTTFYLTDDNNPTGYAQPIEQKPSAAAAPSVTYIIGDPVRAQADSSGAVSYFLTDGHGSTRALTNSVGAVTGTFNYTAFGGAIGFTPSASTPIYLFGGDALFDYASGLYMHGDGTRGRVPGTDGFIEADSSGNANAQDPITLHKYLYANAGPTTYSDPSGHDGELVGTLAATSVASTLNGIESAAFSAVYESAKGFAEGLTANDVFESFLLNQAIGVGVGVGIGIGLGAFGALRNGLSFDLGSILGPAADTADLYSLVGKQYEAIPGWKGMTDVEHAAFIRTGIRDFYDWYVFKGGNPKVGFINADSVTDPAGSIYVGRLNWQLKRIYLTRGADGATFLEELLHTYQLVRDGVWDQSSLLSSLEKSRYEAEVEDMMEDLFGLVRKND